MGRWRWRSGPGAGQNGPKRGGAGRRRGRLGESPQQEVGEEVLCWGRLRGDDLDSGYVRGHSGWDIKIPAKTRLL